MTPGKLSSLISLGVAIIVLIASFKQWWDITWNGTMLTKKWVKIFFVICIILLIVSAVLLFIN